MAYLCNNILNAVFTGTDFMKIKNEKYVRNDFTFVRPFYNISTEDISEFNNDKFCQQEEQTYNDNNMYGILEQIGYLYHNFQPNVLKMYREKINFEKAFEYKLEPLYNEIKEYKYGFTFNTGDNYIPYKIWEKILNMLREKYEINVTDLVIQKLYFACNSCDTIIEGELTENWRFYFGDNNLIVYNYTELQEILYNMKTTDSFELVDNDITKHFLDGNLYYQCDNDEGEYVLIDPMIINYNIPSEILRNFRFKNYGNGMFAYT